MIHKYIFWLLLTVVTSLAWLPVDNPALTQNHADKVNHVLAFTVLTVVLCRAYGQALAKVGLVMLGYGLLIEMVQSVLPYRFGSMADAAADVIGILLGLGLVLAWRWTIAPASDEQ